MGAGFEQMLHQPRLAGQIQVAIFLKGCVQNRVDALEFGHKYVRLHPKPGPCGTEYRPARHSKGSRRNRLAISSTLGLYSSRSQFGIAAAKWIAAAICGPIAMLR